MISKLLIAWALLAACVVIHAVGVTTIARAMQRQLPSGSRFWPWTWIFIRVAGWIIVLHLIEIGAWAAIYVSLGAMPGLQEALYFSGVTYTTTGYGDLVLPPEWRLVGAVEALTGIMMCAWSTGFFVAVVGRMIRPDQSAERAG